MTVVYNQAQQTFKASELMFAKDTVINSLVAEMLVAQTEGFIDMIVDMQAQEPITRDSINNTLQGVKDSAYDLLGDLMFDLEQRIRQRLDAVNYGAAVTGIKFDLAGDVTDIEVDISVS